MPYKDRDDQRRAWREHYDRNRAKYNARSRARTASNQQNMIEYLADKECVDCGENDPVTLQFDHQRDKTIAVSVAVRDGWSWARILDEIAKCELVCANCHARRTARQFGWYSFGGGRMVEPTGFDPVTVEVRVLPPEP